MKSAGFLIFSFLFLFTNVSVATRVFDGEPKEGFLRVKLNDSDAKRLWGELKIPVVVPAYKMVKKIENADGTMSMFCQNLAWSYDPACYFDVKKDSGFYAGGYDSSFTMNFIEEGGKGFHSALPVGFFVDDDLFSIHCVKSCMEHICHEDVKFWHICHVSIRTAAKLETAVS